MDEPLRVLREATVSLLNGEASWSQHVETELEKSGTSIRLTEQTHSQHIATLFAKHVALCAEKETLLVKVNTAEERLLQELRRQSAEVYSLFLWYIHFGYTIDAFHLGCYFLSELRLQF